MTSEFLSTPDSRAFPMGEEKIPLLERITEETNPLALRNLKEQYNRVIDRQLERHRGPLLDPIEHLPPEIWLQIFRDVGSGGQDDDESNPIDHLLLASLVSPKWRDAILNTPEIWTEVTVDPASTSGQDELFKLQLAMHLSGRGLLTLILKQSSYKKWEGENGIHRIISTHARRIQKISFGDATLPHEAVNTILLSLGPLPQLRVVQVPMQLSWSLLSWDDFLSNAPALVSINLVLPSGVLQGDSIKSCCRISVSQPLGDISTHLVRFQRLTGLSCWGDNDMPTYPSQLCLDPFGDLEELNCYQTDIQPLLCILQATAKLTTLSISVAFSWSILTGILHACHLLRSLFSLEIKLFDPLIPGDPPLSVPAGPLMIRSLVIHYYLSVGVQDKKSVESACGHIAELVDVLHLCTPAVEEFDFHAGLMDYVPFKYISSRRHLFRLTLSLPELTSIPDDMLIQSKSLVCLNLQMHTTLISSFFRGLECPNLHRTVFLADQKYDRPLSSPIVTFDPAALPHLESIEWRNRPVFWQIASLQGLRKLILAGWNREVVSQLCFHFIMRPHNCPSLEYIEFGAIPEWDLLFMMLERRNHSTRHGVSRITTLVFPAAVTYRLLAPITQLLNGRFATELSYHDVSISGIAEFYFDKSITGCTSCLFSMNICTREVVIQKRCLVQTWSRPKYPSPPAVNPPLSAEMSSWLDGREERERNWDAKDTEWRQHCNWRPSFCLEPIRSKRMVVTEWTLRGKSALIAFHLHSWLNIGIHLDTDISNRDN